MPRYFIHILTERERIVDPEGHEFPDPASARYEASQSARDLMAEELRCGRFVPSRWRVQIAAADGSIVAAIPFAALLFSPDDLVPLRSRPTVTDPDLIDRAKATFARARASHAEIGRNISQLREVVRNLGEISKKLGLGGQSVSRG
jgi:hypothetical protein